MARSISPSRREFLATTGLALAATKLKADPTDPVLLDLWFNTEMVATYCYIEAELADPAPPYNFTGIGYKHPDWFGNLATAADKILAYMEQANIVGQAAASASLGPANLNLVSMNNLAWVMNQSQSKIFADFFNHGSWPIITQHTGVPLTRPENVTADQVRLCFASFSSVLRQYAQQNYAGNIRRGHLETVLFHQAPDSSLSLGVLTAASVGLGTIGLGLLAAAGGILVITGAVAAPAGVVALAWIGLSMTLISATSLTYVIVRILWQQMHQSGPWKPKPAPPKDLPMPRPGTPSAYLYPPLWSSTPPDHGDYISETISLVH